MVSKIKGYIWNECNYCIFFNKQKTRCDYLDIEMGEEASATTPNPIDDIAVDSAEECNAFIPSFQYTYNWTSGKQYCVKRVVKRSQKIIL